MNDPLSHHRPNVGVVLFHADGRVWMGHRGGFAPDLGWQFPQGGVDGGEALETAARRELREETGVVSVELLGRTGDWLSYDFPPEVVAEDTRRGRSGWAGQKQIWFAFRFTGDEAEIDLGSHPPAEFDAWRWEGLATAPALAVPFKRATYGAIAQAFAQYSDPT